jgi:hypothetical protein
MLIFLNRINKILQNIIQILLSKNFFQSTHLITLQHIMTVGTQLLTDHAAEHFAVVGTEGVSQKLRFIFVEAPGVP